MVDPSKALEFNCLKVKEISLLSMQVYILRMDTDLYFHHFSFNNFSRKLHPEALSNYKN